MRALSVLLAVLVGAALSRVLVPPTAAAAGGPADFTQVIAASEPGIVHVTTVLSGGRVPASRDDAVGAGFVVSADGLVLTSRHVVAGAERVFAELPGRPKVEVQVLGTDDATDVALLKLPLTGLVPLPIGDPNALRAGQWVLAVGSPYHLPRSWSVGIVSGLHRTGIGVGPRAFEDWIQTDAAANIGSSGGPLLDSSGNVVGVLTAILSRTGVSQGISLALPIDAAMAAVGRLGGRPEARPGSLGLVVRETEAAGVGRGLEVLRYETGSTAMAAGLQPGDVIVSVERVPTPSTADLQRALWGRRPGSPVVVEFWRRGRERLQATVTLR